MSRHTLAGRPAQHAKSKTGLSSRFLRIAALRDQFAGVLVEMEA